MPNIDELMTSSGRLKRDNPHRYSTGSRYSSGLNSSYPHTGPNSLLATLNRYPRGYSPPNVRTSSASAITGRVPRGASILGVRTDNPSVPDSQKTSVSPLKNAPTVENSSDSNLPPLNGGGTPGDMSRNGSDYSDWRRAIGENFSSFTSSSSSGVSSQASAMALANAPGAVGSGGGGLAALASGFLTQNGKLAQDIYEEFLVCKICLDGYKSPKCLSCLHTFCENCIESHANAEQTYKKYSDYRDFTCPLCRKRTQLPVGGVKKLSDNFLVTSLMELVKQRGGDSVAATGDNSPKCDICKATHHRQRDAVCKCIDCGGKLLCKNCMDSHRETRVTAQHGLIDVGAETEIECRTHSDEVVRFYCIPCEVCVCVVCTFDQHKGHDMSSFSEAVSKYKDEITEVLDQCKQKLTQGETRLENLAVCQKSLDETEELIRETTINYITEIREAERKLLDELHALYGGADSIEIKNRKSELQSEVDGLKATCNLAELVLKGRDMELLMIRKQVQAKLSSLAKLDTKPGFYGTGLPSQIRFVPGTNDLGYLMDIDKPVASINKARLRKRSVDDAGVEFYKNSDTQTTREDFRRSGGLPEIDSEKFTTTLQQTDRVLMIHRGTLMDIPPDAEDDCEDFEDAMSKSNDNVDGETQTDNFELIQQDSSQEIQPSREEKKKKRKNRRRFLSDDDYGYNDLENSQQEEVTSEDNEDDENTSEHTTKDSENGSITSPIMSPPPTMERPTFPDTTETGTVTEAVEMVDKAVNTRCRAIMRPSNQQTPSLGSMDRTSVDNTSIGDYTPRVHGQTPSQFHSQTYSGHQPGMVVGPPSRPNSASSMYNTGPPTNMMLVSPQQSSNGSYFTPSPVENINNNVYHPPNTTINNSKNMSYF